MPYLRNFQIIILAETFVEEKDQTRFLKLLPTNYSWHWTHANRDHVRGRAWGGLLVGVDNRVLTQDYWSDEKKCICGFNFLLDGETYNLTAIYCRKGVKEIQEAIRENLEYNFRHKNIMIGDWNARTGNLPGNRNSKDLTVNQEGQDLLRLLDDFNHYILNGATEGDWSGEFTHHL